MHTLCIFFQVNSTFSFLTSCFLIAESRLKHNALQHGPRLLRRLARSSFRSNAAMLRAPNSCSKRLSASSNKNKQALSFPKIGKCYWLLQYSKVCTLPVGENYFILKAIYLHIVCHKTSLKKFRRTEIISCIFSDHNSIKLEIIRIKKMWRLNNILSYWTY